MVNFGADNIEQKTSNVFLCKICEYTTERKANYERHKLSAKHKKKKLSKKMSNLTMSNNKNTMRQEDDLSSYLTENEQQKICGESGQTILSNLFVSSTHSVSIIDDDNSFDTGKNEQQKVCCDSGQTILSNLAVSSTHSLSEFDDDKSYDIGKNEQEILNTSCRDQNEHIEKYNCICGSSYKHQRSLLRHKLICKPIDSHTDIQILTNLVLEVVKQNKELMTQQFEVQKQNQELTTKLVEITSKSGNNSTQIIQTNHLNNTSNNTFNLNVFLNEKCKDAMNIMDFVDSLQVQLSDLEDIGKHGFVEGISNLIVRNLKALDVTQRPIHCADKKREILYVKDDNKWEKENDERLKIRKAIKRVATKNQKLLQKYKEKHPGCNFSHSKYSDEYSKLVIEVMDDNNIDKQDKIIRKIANEVVIDKRFQ